VNAGLAVLVGYRVAGLRLDRRTVVLAAASLACTAAALAASHLPGHLVAVAGFALVAGWIALAVPGELRR
jgi:hypothetical protein